MSSWSAVAIGGVVIVSIYLFPSERLSQRNIALLCQVVAVLIALGVPFILGRDFQVHLDQLCASRWPESCGARIVAPQSPTYISAGVESSLAYFVVDRRFCLGDLDAFCEVLPLAMRPPGFCEVLSATKTCPPGGSNQIVPPAVDYDPGGPNQIVSVLLRLRGACRSHKVQVPIRKAPLPICSRSMVAVCCR